MKTKLITLIFLGCFLSWPSMAQERWSVELRPGVNFPTDDLGPVELNTGFGVEATLAYRVLPYMAVYAGWGWNQFSGDGFSSNELDFEETGYTFGLRFIHPLGISNLNYVLSAGGIYNHLEIENSDGDLLTDTGHELGWEIQAGLIFDLGVGFELRPLLSYRSLSTTAEVENFETDLDLKYIALGLGVVKAF